jgi:hypothetical protein
MTPHRIWSKGRWERVHLPVLRVLKRVLVRYVRKHKPVYVSTSKIKVVSLDFRLRHISWKGHAVSSNSGWSTFKSWLYSLYSPVSGSSSAAWPVPQRYAYRTFWMRYSVPVHIQERGEPRTARSISPWYGVSNFIQFKLNLNLLIVIPSGVKNVLIYPYIIMLWSYYISP